MTNIIYLVQTYPLKVFYNGLSIHTPETLYRDAFAQLSNYKTSHPHKQKWLKIHSLFSEVASLA